MVGDSKGTKEGEKVVPLIFFQFLLLWSAQIDIFGEWASIRRPLSLLPCAMDRL